MCTLATQIRLKNVERRLKKRAIQEMYRCLTQIEKRYVKLYQQFEYYSWWYLGTEDSTTFMDTVKFRGDCVYTLLRNALNKHTGQITVDDWECLKREHKHVYDEFVMVEAEYKRLHGKVNRFEKRHNITEEKVKDIKIRMSNAKHKVDSIGSSFSGGYGFIKDIVEEIITFNAKKDDKKVVESTKSLSIIDLLELDEIMHESVLQVNVETQELASFLGV